MVEIWRNKNKSVNMNKNQIVFKFTVSMKLSQPIDLLLPNLTAFILIYSELNDEALDSLSIPRSLSRSLTWSLFFSRAACLLRLIQSIDWH